MKKFDDWLFDKITQITRRWVKKHKFMKHKIDLMIKVQKWETAVYIGLAILLAAKDFFIYHRAAGAVITLVVWGFVVIMQFTRFPVLQRLRESYDWIWMARKHPEIYEHYKQFCKDQHENDWEWRKIFLIITAVFSLLNIMLLSPVIIIFAFSVFSMYIKNVFDFDEPDQTKKAKDSVTDIIKEKLKSLVERTVPRPMGSPV